MAVIASHQGCRYNCEVWGGKPWVRANDRPTRQALRGALHPSTDLLPASQEAMEASGGRRPDRVHPWVGTSVSCEGRRGDGAPDCGGAYLRARNQAGFKTAKETRLRPLQPPRARRPLRRMQGVLSLQEDPHRKGGPPDTAPPAGRPANGAAPTQVDGRRPRAAEAEGGPRSRRSAPRHRRQVPSFPPMKRRCWRNTASSSG